MIIVFYMTVWQPEWHLSPFVSAYMAPRLGDESLLVGGRVSLISSPNGIGP